MKKSECYHMAMLAVLRSDFTEDQMIEIMTVLISDKGTALFAEKLEAEEVQA